MKVQIAIIALIFSTVSLFGQNYESCKQVLKEEITLNDLQLNIDQFTKNFQTLVYCEFDSIDYQIFMGPQGSFPFFVQSVISPGNNPFENSKKFTFKDLRDLLVKFKQTEEYIRVKKIVEARNEIVLKEATLQNWNVDEELLMQMGVNANQLTDIHSIIEKYDHKQYSEIFNIYSDSVRLQDERRRMKKLANEFKVEKKNPEPAEWLNGLKTYDDFELGLRKSNEQNKSLLIYFNAYGSMNAREFESDILKERKIQDYINSNLIFVNLYVDQRTKLNENEIYFSEVLNKDVIYTGQRNLEIEKKLFQANVQPLFVLLDPQGNEISKIAYAKDIKTFNEFLMTSEK